MRSRIFAALLALGTGASLASVACRPRSRDAEAAVEYFCVMHPQVVQDRPGSCPICQMKLERRTKGGSAVGSRPTAAAPAIDGRAPVALSPADRQRLGVRTAAVVRAPMAGERRTVGRVTVDERRVHHVHTKFEGYVERLYVDYTGKLVEKGEALLSIYSPELLATQQEYLIARRSQNADLVASARRRLLLWDISTEDIRGLDETGEAQRTLELHAPMRGYVIAKTAVHGMRVTPMDALFSLADLSRVWVLADVYEHDIGRVRPGASATVRSRHQPDRTWRGTVTFVAPTVDEATRTVKVRVEVGNGDAELKPEMFVDVALRYDDGMHLSIPADAVIDTGRRQIVFVEEGDGRLVPREVAVGPKAGDLVPVTSGLREGETVVRGASFLLDSESSLRAALNATTDATDAPPSSSHAGH